MSEDTPRAEDTARKEDIAGLLVEADKPSLRAQAALRRHLASDAEGFAGMPVLTEAEYATVAGLGIAAGIAASLLLTRNPLLSLVIGLVAGAVFAELVLSTQKRAARKASTDRR